MLSCPIPDYGSRFDNVDVVGAAAILNVLAHTHTNPHLVPAHDTPSVPKLIHLKIQHNFTGKDWNAFLRRWDTFHIGFGITSETAPS